MEPTCKASDATEQAVSNILQEALGIPPPSGLREVNAEDLRGAGTAFQRITIPYAKGTVIWASKDFGKSFLPLGYQPLGYQ